MKKLFFCSGIFLLLLLSCADNISSTNEHDRDFEGNYRVGYAIDPSPDTMDIFHNYSIVFSNEGDYNFKKFMFTTDPPGMVMEIEAQKADTACSLYFTSPFSGQLTLTGIRPNEKTVDTACSVTVVNPYAVMVADSGLLFASDTLEFHFINSRTGQTPPDHFFFRIQSRGKEIDNNFPSDTFFSIAVSRPDSFTVLASVCDTQGNCVECKPLPVYVPLMVTPTVTITEKVLIAPVGKPFTIVASAENTDSLVWWIKKSKLKTVTTSFSHSHTWNDTTDDMVIVTAKNRFNMTGNSDTLMVQVREIDFELDLISFPTAVPAQKISVWEVAAKKEGTLLPDSEVVYVWQVFPESSIKSQDVDNGRLSLKPNDNTKNFTISVFAIYGNATIPGRAALVQVTADRPVVELLPYTKKTGIGDTVPFTVRTYDINDDGTVKNIYCRKHLNDKAVLIDNGLIPLVFDLPGNQMVAFWCTDDDGFTSDTVYASLTVTSSTPWFTWHDFDTTVYVDESMTLSAPASAAEDDRTLVKWLWDEGGDGEVDFSTDVDHLDTLFTEAGVVVFTVTCIDNENDTSDVPMTITITVAEGRPEVISVTPHRSVLYRGDTLSVTIEAMDENGTVDSVYVGTDTSSFMTVPVASYSGDIARATARIVMPATGTFALFAAALDDDGRVSTWMVSDDKVTVKEGVPVVIKLSPSSVWINQPAEYTIDAYDNDGTIETFDIQWEQDGDWVSTSGAVVEKAYETSGVKAVRIVAHDNFGNASDTFVTEVNVKQGRPLVSDEDLPDTVWIYQENDYMVLGTDENGDITTYYAGFGNDEFGTGNSDGNFKYTFTDTGSMVVSCFVEDNDGIRSDTVQHKVYVKLGAPAILSILLSKDTNDLFINDEITYTINASDENGTIAEVLAWPEGDTTTAPMVLSVTDATASITHAFTSANMHPLWFRVKDDDGITKDSMITVNVRKGTPVITSASCDSAPTIWVNDTYTYRVICNDTNGLIRKIYVNWDGGEVPQDTVTVGGGGKKSVTEVFSHTYDTSTAGVKKIRFTVEDDDGLLSKAATVEVNVHKGRPFIWAKDVEETIRMVKGDKIDTLFYVDRYFESDVDIKVAVKDTNKSPGIRFFWDWDSNGGIDTVTTIGTGISFGTATFRDGWDKGRKLTVYCRDNDSLKSNELKLYVYHDMPPPVVTPTGLYPESWAFYLYWMGLDKHDSLNTEFAIAIDLDSSDQYKDTLMHFRKANTTQESGPGEYFYWNKYNDEIVLYYIVYSDYYPPMISGKVKFTFKIIARDMHGNLSEYRYSDKIGLYFHE